MADIVDVAIGTLLGGIAGFLGGSIADHSNPKLAPASIRQTAIDGINYQVAQNGYDQRYIFIQTASNAWERIDSVANKNYSELTNKILSSTSGGSQ